MKEQPTIFQARGRQVMLATDLASLFGVTPKRLNEQIRRNERRFPPDFAFRLTAEETADLRPQFEASSSSHGGHRHPPFVLTEYGVVMLANVLNSDRAIAVSVQVVREFIRLRTIARSSHSLRRRIALLSRLVTARLSRHDAEINHLFQAVQSLIAADADPAGGATVRGFAP